MTAYRRKRAHAQSASRRDRASADRRWWLLQDGRRRWRRLLGGARGVGARGDAGAARTERLVILGEQPALDDLYNLGHGEVEADDEKVDQDNKHDGALEAAVLGEDAQLFAKRDLDAREKWAQQRSGATSDSAAGHAGCSGGYNIAREVSAAVCSTGW